MFTCDEEVGGLGADTFCMCHAEKSLPAELDALNFIVEVDRRGSNDAVYYDCANPDFEDYISSKGFKTEHGSFSDISYIAPKLGVAAVNVSCGYYNAHQTHEYINRAELELTINRLLNGIDELVARYKGDVTRDVKDCLESCTNATGELGFAVEQLESFTGKVELKYFDEFGDEDDE